MTKDEILNMPAGEAIDALVAEFVMDEPEPDYTHEEGHIHKVVWSGHRNWFCVLDYEKGDKCEWQPADFSTFIGSAWLVVERMMEKYCLDFSLSEGYNASFLTGDEWVNATSSTMPLAICQSALLVIMEIHGNDNIV